MNKDDLIRYADDLLRTAMYKLDGADAEDLVQETMLAALLAIRQGLEIKDPRHWLQGVLRRKYYDFLRQKYRRPTVSFDALYEQQYWEQAQEDEQLLRLERTEEAAALRRELARQAGIYREVLGRYYMRGESVGEIARALGISANTVKSRLHAGREHIRKDFTMEKYEKQSYEPERLNLAISGECGINGEPFSLGVGDSMIKQNLLILAYDRPVTLRELSEALGIAAAYIEPEVNRLVDGELMKRVGDKVYTDFIIYREEDWQATVELQREMADRRYREIWETVEQGLAGLREQDFYQKQRTEARRKLESQAAICMLQQAVWTARKEITGEQLPFAAFPDRKNGGKWFAMGNHFAADYDWDAEEHAYRRYWIDGESNRTLEGYDGHKSVGLSAYDCLLGHTYLSCGCRGIPEDMLHRILYLTAYGREKELALVSPRILEQLDVLLELDLLARGGNGRLECLVPVITKEDRNYIKNLGQEYGALIDRKFHDEYLALVRHPVKLPCHLKSVTEWYRYNPCGSCITMMLAERARENSLFLPGYDGPAPSIYLVVEE